MIDYDPDTRLCEVACDRCSSGHLEFEADDFQAAVREIRRQGWYVFRDEHDEWCHHCTDCGLDETKKRRRRRRVSRSRKVTEEQRRVRDYDIQEREATLLDLLQTYPTQVIRGLALQPDAGWMFGCLHLVGVIDRNQYEAARYLDRVTREYEKLLKQYGDLSAGGYTKSDTPAREDLSLSAQKKIARARRRYDEVYELLRQCGRDVQLAVDATLRRGEKGNLEAVRRGLTVISAGLAASGRRRSD